jgi:predicted transcriptional regulator
MTEKAIVSCQIPQDWKVKIEHLATERKKEPSQIIYEALAQYLGQEVNRNESRLNTLEAEITTLRGSISQLELIVKHLQQRSHVVAAGSNSSTVSVNPSPIQSVQPFIDDDLMEDEPDEILIDFLPPEQR